MKTVRILFGVFLALLAFGFYVNLAREQATWGTGGWTNAGRAHSGTMVAAMLISTLPFALLFALSLFGSLMLLKSAAAYRTVLVLELVFGGMILLTAAFVGLYSINGARSVESLFEGAFFVLLEAAASIILLFLALRSEPLQRGAGKAIKIILAVVLFLIALISALAINDTLSMSRYETIRTQVIAVLVTYIIMEFGGGLVLLITAFRKRKPPEPSLSIA